MIDTQSLKSDMPEFTSGLTASSGKLPKTMHDEKHQGQAITNLLFVTHRLPQQVQPTRLTWEERFDSIK